MTFTKTFTSKDLAYIFKRLSFLLKAGISIQESIKILEFQTSSKRQKELFQKIHTDLSQGISFSRSLESYPKIFPPSITTIIKMGEEIGTLADNVQHLSEELLKKDLLKRKIVSSLIYPAFIGVGTVALSIFLLGFIFPKIRPLFTNMKVELPLTTRLLIFISDFIQQYGLLFGLILVFIFIALFILIKKNNRAHIFKDRIVLSIPLLGKIIKYYLLSTITRNLGIILRAGVPVQEALLNTTNAIANKPYYFALQETEVRVSAGEQISTTFQQYPKLFPSLVSSMMSVAERSGTLSETLLYLSSMYEYEVEESTKTMSSALEPLLMTTMGIIVGFISLSIVTPIYSLTQNIKH